jgi:HEPN superfamily RES-like protein/RES domain-containing protein
VDVTNEPNFRASRRPHKQDDFVCADCFEDEALKEFVRASSEAFICDYCDAEADAPIAAPMSEVLDLISESLHAEYQEAEEANLPVEEGEYVFKPMSTSEVFGEIGTVTENERLLETILTAFDDFAWVSKPFYSPPEDDALRYNWKEFVRAVKYRRRYLFLLSHRRKKRQESDAVPPEEMLRRIGEVIEQVDLVQEMKPGTRWFRVRVHDYDGAPTTAAALGTAPRRRATSNRMSPAGIPMFYGASDPETAFSETFTPRPGEACAVTVALFETARSCWVVDFSKLPPVPSLFDSRRRHLRRGIAFLHGFVRDLTKKVKRDGREHIDYVPTQIVTEYLRYAFKPFGFRVSGIVYDSAQREGGICCALFFRNTQCCEPTSGWREDPKKQLALIRVIVRHQMTGCTA